MKKPRGVPVTFETVIGLEVHIQLATRTKLFCGCATAFDAPPNSQICPVCSGQPGALPRLNRRAVELAVSLALALGCEVNRRSVFSRKAYFYPDLPKGYQITQFNQPLAKGGALQLDLPGQFHCDEVPAELPLTRLHLEEDAGKTISRGDTSLVDLNRAGVPLVELVGAPVVTTPALAAEALRQLRRLVRALEVSDGNMEQGSLRCDANISLMPAGAGSFGARVELKNLNSFRFVERALIHEQIRQGALLQRGRAVAQETRLFDNGAGLTRSLRGKEAAHDYRHFDEPDLPALELPPGLRRRLAADLPELPNARRVRLTRLHGLKPEQAQTLCSQHELADYFEATVQAGAPAHLAASWLLGEVLAQVPDPRELADAPVTPGGLAALLSLLDRGQTTRLLARQIWQRMWATSRPALEIAQQEDLLAHTDEGGLRATIQKVLAEHPDQAEAYRAGQHKLLGFFMGQVMSRAGGRVDPKAANRLIREELNRS
jgi:aspartyl-tRNA(Asn)/glutamyl-tRNA(Gln) amidotransferase subunit B